MVLFFCEEKTIWQAQRNRCRFTTGLIPRFSCRNGVTSFRIVVRIKYRPTVSCKNIMIHFLAEQRKSRLIRGASVLKEVNGSFWYRMRIYHGRFLPKTHMRVEYRQFYASVELCSSGGSPVSSGKALSCSGGLKIEIQFVFEGNFCLYITTEPMIPFSLL